MTKIIQPTWPTPDEVEEFYGRPWEDSSLLVQVWPPWFMYAAWEPTILIPRFTVNRRCAESLERICIHIWDASGHDNDVIRFWGMHLYGGCYANRNIRGGKAKSMHAYGCAVDFDPLRNALGNPNPNFAKIPEVLAAFDSECWSWGGNFETRPDGMHWEAVRR